MACEGIAVLFGRLRTPPWRRSDGRIRAVGRLLARLYFGEEIGHHFDFLTHDFAYPHAEPLVLEQLAQRIAVDQVDRGRPVAGGLPSRVGSERARGDDQPLIGAPLHRPAKVAYSARRN